ncbi:VOC family protein [Nesterenkonia populi]
MTQQNVKQMRVVVEAEDYDEAVTFYREVLGMPEQAAFSEGGDDRVVILSAGNATLEIATPTRRLEIATPTRRKAIDRVETSGGFSRRIRLAFEVDDAAATTSKLQRAGAEVTAEPVETPWQSLNARLEAPADLQITVFEELETMESRRRRPGFSRET